MADTHDLQDGKNYYLDIFQREASQSMIQAVRAVVHGGETPAKAFDLYNTLKTAK